MGPGFVYVPGGNAAVGCTLRSAATQSFRRQIAEAEQALGLDVELAVILSTNPLGCAELFYDPIKNDIAGIGYAHSNGQDQFDELPELRLEGIAFLNDWPYWERYVDEFRTAFLHEVGHRWGARIGAVRGGVEYRLTGREHGHWSYFLDSGGSPLEGNRFSPTKPFVTETPEWPAAYSPLDLYLMGLIEAEAVGPIRLLEPGSGDGTDCVGAQVTAASPPQTCEPKTLRGAWVSLGMEDVIAFEGARRPSAEESPKERSIGVFVFGEPGTAWSEAACEGVVSAIDARLEDFFQATGKRMRLKNAIKTELSCSELSRIIVAAPEDANEPRLTGGCSMSPKPPDCKSLLGAAALLLCWLARRRYSN